MNDTCQVRGAEEGWLYAVGDVNQRALLAHQGKYQARIADAAISARAAGHPLDTDPWGAHATTADHHAVPQVVVTDPEVAGVGLTGDQAKRAGYETQVVDIDIDIDRVVMGALLFVDGYQGRARMVVDRERGFCSASPSSAPG